MAALAVVGGLASLYGGASQYSSKKNEGFLAEAGANIKANQMEDQAIAERGMAAMEAKEKRRQGNLLRSKAIAAAAAGGRAASMDKGASDIIGDISEETEFGALTSLLQGKVRASNLQMEASTMRSQGAIARKSSNKAARAGLLTSFGQAASTFGQKYSSTK
jgi:propanediol dehydratase small subunit